MKDGEVVQIGTPAEVVMSPATDYVREFTKDVPRTRVLRARSLMQQPPVVVSVKTASSDVVTQLEQTSSPVAYVTDEQGQFIGVITREQLQSGNGSGLDSLINRSQTTVTPETLLSDLVRLAVASNIPLPVVDDENQLVGALDQKTVMLALGGHTE
jgi:glycine betaine/proline transport system ATP-binding protein